MIIILPKLSNFLTKVTIFSNEVIITSKVIAKTIKPLKMIKDIC